MVKAVDTSAASPVVKLDPGPEKKPSPEKKVPVEVTPVVEKKNKSKANKVEDDAATKRSSGVLVSDVSSRLLSPSDVTGVVRRFPKRQL